MTDSWRTTTGLLVRAHPTTGEGPIRRLAEITIYALGEDQDEIIPCLRVLGDFNLRSLRELQVSLPRTLVLPRTYYDRSDTFVKLLRSTGTRFRISSFPWVCPDELSGGAHSCHQGCMVQEIQEDITN